MENEITPEERRSLIEETLFGPGPATVDYGEGKLESPTVEEIISSLIVGASLAVQRLTDLANSADQDISLEASKTLLDYGYEVVQMLIQPAEED